MLSALDELGLVEADLASPLILAPGVEDQHVELRVLLRLQSPGVIRGFLRARRRLPERRWLSRRRRAAKVRLTFVLVPVILLLENFMNRVQ